jgi:hypothetical protein
MDRATQHHNPDYRSRIQFIRTTVTDEMVRAGLLDFFEWQESKEANPELPEADLVCQIYAAMRQIEESTRLSPHSEG